MERSKDTSDLRSLISDPETKNYRKEIMCPKISEYRLKTCDPASGGGVLAEIRDPRSEISNSTPDHSYLNRKLAF